jgi:hypothetical protein
LFKTQLHAPPNKRTLKNLYAFSPQSGNYPARIKKFSILRDHYYAIVEGVISPVSDNTPIKDRRILLLSILAASSVMSMGAILLVFYTMHLDEFVTVALILAVLIADLVAALFILRSGSS